MNSLPTSLLHYYQEHCFNPVELKIEDPDRWADHVRKRRSLYQGHLCIPPRLLAGKRILEYGCNSGENALYLAQLGARLVLVEPNAQVIPRLNYLFRRFSVTQQIDDIRVCSIEDFSDPRSFDLVIAEGFLNTLPTREPMLRKICAQISPGGLGVISFDHRSGSLLELLRKTVFLRTIDVAGIDDPHSPLSFGTARQLFEEDFGKLNASRDFYSWWKDSMVNPFYGGDVFWDYEDILPLIASQDCDFYSTSPRFVTADFYAWYKDVEDRDVRASRVRRDIAGLTPYFLTGDPELACGSPRSVAPELARCAMDLVGAMAAFTGRLLEFEEVAGKLMVFELLSAHDNAATRRLAGEALRLFAALRKSSAAEIQAAWTESVELRRRWGVPYHYLAFSKSN